MTRASERLRSDGESMKRGKAGVTGPGASVTRDESRFLRGGEGFLHDKVSVT